MTTAAKKVKITVAAVYLTCPVCSEAIPDRTTGSEMHDRVPDEVTCPRCQTVLRVPKSVALPRGY